MSQRLIALVTSALLVGTLFVSAPSPARAVANDIYISFDTLADTGSCANPDYTADGIDDHDVIMDAVTATKAGGTLHFCAGTYDINATIDLSGTDITLHGAAAATTVLDGGGTVQILSSSGAITVSALTFQDGCGRDAGAINASTASVTDSTFSDNIAANGGAITATTAIVTASTFTNNQSLNWGGAIYAGTSTVSTSIFTSNHAEVYGGAIYAVISTVSTSTFTNNDAFAGGAIYASNMYAPTITVSTSTFTGNRSDIGGAIAASTATVATSTFTNNQALIYGGAINVDSTATVSNSSFNGNHADYGGAINVYSTATVSNSSFNGNHAEYGGGLRSYQAATIINSTFTNNTAAETGGAISAGTVTYATGGTFTGNVAGHGGAVAYAEGGGTVCGVTKGAPGVWELCDNTPPQTTLTRISPNPSSDVVSFDLSSDEAASFECNLDGAGWGVCYGSHTISDLTDGTHVLLARATDTAGNVDLTPAREEWVVDTTPPETTIDSTPSSTSSDAVATFTFSGSDNLSSVTFECSVDEASFAACTSPFTTATLAAGSHTFAVRAVDAAGRTDGSPATYSWTIQSDQTGLPFTDTSQVLQLLLILVIAAVSGWAGMRLLAESEELTH